MSAQIKGSASGTQKTEKIHVELPPNLSVVKNVTTVSVMTLTSESTILSAGTTGPDLEGKGSSSSSSSSVPSKVLTTTFTPSPPDQVVPVPPKGITAVNVPLGPEQEEEEVLAAAKVETVLLDTTTSVDDSTDQISAPLDDQVTSSSDQSIEEGHVLVPPHQESSTASSSAESNFPLNPPIESTESVSSNIASEPVECIKPEVSAASVENVPLNTVESTESAPPEVTLETSAALAESVPLDIPPPPSSVSPPTPLESSVAPTESSPALAAVEMPPKVASDQVIDQSCVRPDQSVVQSTEVVVVPPDVAKYSSTGSGSTAPAEQEEEEEVTIACPLKPKQKVTMNMSTENNNRPHSTTASNAVAPSPPQTEPSRFTTAPHQQLITKARADAVDLHRAFKGLTCDATTIVNILSKRSATHRTLIREEYNDKFSEDFDHRLSRELQFKPKLQRAVLLWMDEPARRDAKLVKHGLSIHMNVAIEVICSRTPSQIEQLKEAYHTMFGVDLLEDIKSHAHFDHKKLLLAFAGNKRSEGLDEMKVDEDAKVLFKDGEWKLGTDEDTFIRILSERSSAHLVALNSAYQTMYVNSLKKAVKKETSFKFKFGLLTILQCAENRGKYFAKALHKAMKGVGTRDETLTRIIVSRAEDDIQQIKVEYKKKYGKELSDDVHSDTSGHYRAFLLSVLNLKVA